MNLANAFADFGYPVDLLLARSSGAYMHLVSPKINVIEFGAKKASLALGPLVRYLKKTRPDALMSALDTPNIVAVLAKKLSGAPIKVSISIRNTLSVEYQTAGRMTRLVIPRLAQVFFPMADNILTVSQGVADDAEVFLKLPKGRVRAMWNPVVTPQLMTMVNEPLDHPWFAKGEPPVIVGVGRLSVQKNFPMLINAFAMVRKVIPARLMILGEGDDRAALEAQVASLALKEDVALPGFVKNPYQYLKAARVFALSSNFEGLPTVLIESLAAGTPVVSTDCPSGPQEILKGGKFGPIVPVGDADAFAKALLDELSKPKQMPPRESWEPFERDSIARSYLEVLLPAKVAAK